MFTPYYDPRKAAVTFPLGWWSKLKRYHYKFLCHTALHLAFISSWKETREAILALKSFLLWRNREMSRKCLWHFPKGLWLCFEHFSYDTFAALMEWICQWRSWLWTMALDFKSTMVNIKSSHARHKTIQYIQDLQPLKANVWSWPCSHRKMTTCQFNQLSSS